MSQAFATATNVISSDSAPEAKTALRPTLGLPLPSYYDPDIHQQEADQLFRRQWIFVGFARQLENHQDYLVKVIGGVSVVVQNFDGKICALHNVCSHRNSILRTAPGGRGPLQCPYHGWSYDGEGVPVGIPGNQDHFCFNDHQKRERALKQFEVGVCGDFVFVRVTPGGPDLKTFLGNNWDLLLHLTEHFGHSIPIDEVVMPWATNWKIGMESVLEVYHVDAVHPETFKKLVKLSWQFAADGLHSVALSPLKDDMKDWWNRAIQRLKLNKSPRFDEYDHFVIFPNIAIGLTRGSLMSFQTYEPTGATTSDLHYRMILANSPLNPNAEDFVRQSVAQTIVDFNRKLLDEDRLASELSQQGLMQSDRRATIGINEGRIRLFHEAIEQFVPSA